MALTEVQMGPDEGYAYWSVMQTAQWHKDITKKVFDLKVDNTRKLNYSGTIVKTDVSSYEIRTDARLDHDLLLIVRSLIAHRGSLAYLKKFGRHKSSPLPGVIRGNLLEASKYDVNIVRRIVIGGVKKGVESYLKDIYDMDHVYCNAANDLSGLDDRKWISARIAVNSAIIFILQHELSHLLCGHYEYLVYLRSQERIVSPKSQEMLQSELRLLELVADINAEQNLCMLIGSMASEFTKTEKYFDLSARVYMTAAAAGLGITTYFLLLDQVAEIDLTHPRSGERIFWLARHTLSSCPNEKEQDEAGAEIVSFYKAGFFAGIKEAIRLWDKSKIYRTSDSDIEPYFTASRACPLCDGSTKFLFEKFRSLSRDFKKLEDRMETANVFDGFKQDNITCAYQRPGQIHRDLEARAKAIIVLGKKLARRNKIQK